MKSLLTLIMLGAVVACSQEPPPAATPGAAAPVVFTAGDPPVTPEALAGSDGALGSGCAPNANALPDGAWFGYATNWDAAGIDFDLACFYVGDAAAAQASAHNSESPPPNDFYLVNDNTTTRRVDVAENSVVHRLTSGDGPVGLERTTYSGLIADSGPPGIAPCPGEWCAIWVFVNDGRVTEVMQQYTP